MKSLRCLSRCYALNRFYVGLLLIIGLNTIAKAQYQLKIDSLLSLMTLEEKAGQLSIFTNDLNEKGNFIQDQYVTLISQGAVGGIFNAHGAEYTRRLQKIAVEKSRLGIPLLFAFDVIHGHHTIFPVPIAEAASWDLESIEKSARVAATEATATGLHWVFAPMCDVSRDPRWGRVMEGAGEDTYLASAIASARVKGLQSTGFKDADAVAACVKHFAAYGAPQAGREYHTVDMSEITLREIYLPPYKSAIDAGALTVMSAFNEVNGVPSTANSFLLKDILRNEWKFDGIVVSDYTSVLELMNHGIAADTSAAAFAGFVNGTDIDMQSGFYNHSLPTLVRKGIISETLLNDAVAKVIELKLKLGLFEDPYRFCSEEREKTVLLSPQNLSASQNMAKKSLVLLKNDGMLPLNSSKQTLALIGPLAKSRQDMIGGWHAAGNGEMAESLYDAISQKKNVKEIIYAMGCETTGSDTSHFQEAFETALLSDKIILALGEAAWMTGEATSRSSIDLPGVQNQLFMRLLKTGKPITVVLFNGRPLTINDIDQNANAVLEAWFPGTKAGSAIASVLFGDENPSGKLPMTFPKSVGQIPIHYNMKNTGRPWDGFTNTTSRYTDIDNKPLYPFGYGLSYSTFEYSTIFLDRDSFNAGESLKAGIKVKNTSNHDGEEVVQLYIRDLVGTVTRPVKELKGFKKVLVPAGEEVLIEFKIDESLLKFYNTKHEYASESGSFELMIGTSSEKFQSCFFNFNK